MMDIAMGLFSPGSAPTIMPKSVPANKRSKLMGLKITLDNPTPQFKIICMGSPPYKNTVGSGTFSRILKITNITSTINVGHKIIPFTLL